MADWPETIAGIRDAVRSGRASAAEVCRATLDRIRAGTGLGAFLAVDEERAMARARAVDAAPGGTDGMLAGVPVAIKDNICTRDLPTTAGSRALNGYVPPSKATVVDRLERAGAVVVGKTNLDEFAMGSSTEHSAFGPARNPWDLDRTPGGSSGGSAAAVAARLVPAALGSDTGGSVRQPAAFCGIVGLKPTYGRVSRRGLVAFASSLDQIGPLTLTVADAATMLEVIGGEDPRDSTTAPSARVAPFAAREPIDLQGLRFGVPRTISGEDVDPEVARAFDAALADLTAQGARIVPIALPMLRLGLPAYYLVATSEASSNLARYDGVRYGHRVPSDSGIADLDDMYRRTRREAFGAEVKRRIMLGTYALQSGYVDALYLKAQAVRTVIRRDYDEAFGVADLVALPTSPTAAFKLGERLDDPLQMYRADVFTVGPSLAGLPAVSLPCGFTAAGLPIGLQLVGRAFDEATLLGAAAAYETARPWWRHAPPVASGSPPAS
jgi:aspartyl-tRNA(Asn)/glutamyl-tRNA(Gln) amidotransferase subunit A